MTATDPYKSTKGWAGRRGAVSGSQDIGESAAEAIERFGTGSPARTVYQSPEHSVAFEFGSPSERYPILSAEDQLVEEEVGEDEAEGEGLGDTNS